MLSKRLHLLLWCTALFAFHGEVYYKFCVAVLFASHGAKVHHCIAHRASLRWADSTHLYSTLLHCIFCISSSIALQIFYRCVIRCITASQTVHPKMGRWYTFILYIIALHFLNFLKLCITNFLSLYFLHYLAVRGITASHTVHPQDGQMVSWGRRMGAIVEGKQENKTDLSRKRPPDFLSLNICGYPHVQL